MMPIYISLGAAVLLCLVHLWVGRFHFLEKSRHSAWLSLSGGIAVAYVFGRTLPKLAEINELLMQATHGGIYGFLEHHAYLMSLIGFILYYSIEWMAAECIHDQKKECVPDRRKMAVLYLHAVCFIGYSLIIGYLIAETAKTGPVPLSLLTLTMMLHLMGTDHSLHHRYTHIYDRYIRWFLVLAVLTGWEIGISTRTSKTAIGLWYAFLSGGIIINVVKDELPDEKHGRLWPFLFGAGVYTALILTLEHFQQ